MIRVLGSELDSPRGRIYQMKLLADGRITLARSAKLQIRNGVIVGEAGVLAPRILAPATLEGALTVGLDGTIRIGSRALSSPLARP
ncbi:MAG: hypothetical protein C4320_08530 [Armatimonadota bacterium]